MIWILVTITRIAFIVISVSLFFKSSLTTNLPIQFYYFLFGFVAGSLRVKLKNI